MASRKVSERCRIIGRWKLVLELPQGTWLLKRLLGNASRKLFLRLLVARRMVVQPDILGVCSSEIAGRISIFVAHLLVWCLIADATVAVEPGMNISIRHRIEPRLVERMLHSLLVGTVLRSINVTWRI